MKENLAIFDLDGTLFDTKQANYYAYKEALGRHSVDLSASYFFSRCFGRHYKDFLPEILGETSLIEEIHSTKQELYFKNLSRVRENTHLFNLIGKIRDDYYIAVVTTASKKNTMELLNIFKCESCFDLILTAEDIIKVKPNPEGFLKAMKHFVIKPENTIIFEDSNMGIEAAKAAGAVVFAVEQF